MDPAQKAEFRSRMEAELEQAKVDVGRLEEATKPISPDKGLGRLTRMEGLNDKAVNEAALIGARNKADKLEKALEKLDTPGFGQCEHCGRPIPVERLLYMPESTRCVQCV